MVASQILISNCKDGKFSFNNVFIKGSVLTGFYCDLNNIEWIIEKLKCDSIIIIKQLAEF